jgi:hypothetical protein
MVLLEFQGQNHLLRCLVAPVHSEHPALFASVIGAWCVAFITALIRSSTFMTSSSVRKLSSDWRAPAHAHPLEQSSANFVEQFAGAPAEYLESCYK